MQVLYVVLERGDIDVAGAIRKRREALNGCGLYQHDPMYCGALWIGMLQAVVVRPCGRSARTTTARVKFRAQREEGTRASEGEGGLQAVHDERVVHADLKPANFVLAQGQVKIIDFGIAKACRTETTAIVRDQLTGTLKYMSPEALKGALHPLAALCSGCRGTLGGSTCMRWQPARRVR